VEGLTTIQEGKFGCIRDLPDHRDIMYSSVREAPKILPSVINLRHMCPKIFNQHPLGSCTASALVDTLGFLEIKDKVVTSIALSRLFIYLLQ
jgi:hypothetical protein